MLVGRLLQSLCNAQQVHTFHHTSSVCFCPLKGKQLQLLHLLMEVGAEGHRWVGRGSVGGMTLRVNHLLTASFHLLQQTGLLSTLLPLEPGAFPIILRQQHGQHALFVPRGHLVFFGF